MEPLSPNALQVLQSRYLLRDRTGNVIETPERLFRRVAYEIAGAEENKNGKGTEYWEEIFFGMLSGLYFLPNSPTLMNAGTALNQLSACFVLPVEEGLDKTFNTLREACIVQQSNGGTGFNFSGLMPHGDHLNGSFPSLGPVATIGIFNKVMQELEHLAKRAGANMGILNIGHPDIEAFIRAKEEEGRFSNFNLSVGITDAFMERVEKNGSWPLLHPDTRMTVKEPAASDLWDQLVSSAWKSGDPGLIFLDEIERKNTVPGYGKLECTNPCGEVPLFPYEACNLGSINLTRFVKEKDGNKYIDWPLMSTVISHAIRFLDNTITVSNYLLPAIHEAVHGNRKTGLGIMGWAEMLIELEIPYRSEKALQLAHQLMKFINETAYTASAILGKERGVFPNWNKSIYYHKDPLRNATRTSIAPTGTISIIANTTPGIEPLFALAFTRSHILGGSTLTEINPALIRCLDKHKLNTGSLLDDIAAIGKFPAGCMVPDHIRELFLTAHDIDTDVHLRHQAAFQLYTDNAVSKTINLPNQATKKTVSRIYHQAWKMGLKGITVFREGSREKEVITTGIYGGRCGTEGEPLCID